MDAETIKAKLREFDPADASEQENALQEILQCMVLASLSRAGLFTEAIFHGGTCLRILFGIARFSEDLDFLLKKPDPGFRWKKYLDAVRKDAEMEGIRFETAEKEQAEATVRKAWLKTDSIGTELIFTSPFPRMKQRKIRIKLEVDTNPPEGSGIETHFLSFPATAPVTTQDLPSAFATKSHALLCRNYTKGRDWYDFLWFANRRIKPRLDVLSNALLQQGQWAGTRVDVDKAWYLAELRNSVAKTDWTRAIEDIRRFITRREQVGLDHWNTEFFLYMVEKMEREW